MVKNAPAFKEIYAELTNLCKDKQIIIYNSDFDLRLIKQSAKKFNLLDPDGIFESGTCVMKWYAKYYAEFDEYWQNYKWQKLQDAAIQQDIDVSHLTAHRAMADCLVTQALIEKVNEKL